VLSINSYVELVKLILAESVKYFALLLLVVLAIRLWRRLPKLSGAAWRGNFFLAGLATLLSMSIGFFSICHSMSIMYVHFGMNAFRAARLDPAFSLFESSLQYRKNADALGGKGVCLLMSGHAEAGISFLNAAKAMRKGRGTPFENYYEGLYYFYRDDQTNAVPFLEAAAANFEYIWEVTKMFAIIRLDRNHPQEAAQLMQPFLQAEITEPDHAYIVACIKLADGRKADARALADKFPSRDMTPYWRARFEQLKARIQNGKT
jgi:tetratricopeptide (TPR) repeat protein